MLMEPGMKFQYSPLNAKPPLRSLLLATLVAVDLALGRLFITNNTSDPEQGLTGANGEGAAKFRYFEKVTPGKRWFWKRRRGKVLPTVWDNFMT